MSLSTSSPWGDWVLAGTSLYYRTIEPNPVVPSSIFRFDVKTAATTLVINGIPGRCMPGLGLSVSQAQDFLFFGKIDRGEGDILLMDSF